MLNNIDKIYIVSYVKNEKLRANIAYQLYYHDITDFEFYYTYDVSENIINNPNAINIKHLSASYAHYDLMKRSYELGYNRIMVFEDDVMFLKDKNEFKNTLNEALSLQDNIVFIDYKIEPKCFIEGVNETWIALQSGYIVDREGMEFYIKNFEKSPHVIDQYTYCYIKDNKYRPTKYGLLWYINNIESCHYLEKQDITLYYINNRLCYQKDLIYDDGPNNIEINKINKDKYFDL